MGGRYQRKDHLYNKAKDEGYRSRAAYKLQELDKKFSFLNRGKRILDLGSFPGGWLQVAAERVGGSGYIVGIDLQPIQPFSQKDFPAAQHGIPSLQIIQGDITDPETLEKILAHSGAKFDVVLSDMSPHLSGIRDRDIARSVGLVDTAFQVAEKSLAQGGFFVAKIFPGPESDELFKKMAPSFAKLQRVCLDSSRKTSNEYYFVGKGFRGGMR